MEILAEGSTSLEATSGTLALDKAIIKAYEMELCDNATSPSGGHYEKVACNVRPFIGTAALGLFLVAGTSGRISGEAIAASPTHKLLTGSHYDFRSWRRDEPAASDAERSTQLPDRLSYIQHHLSLNVSELASALRVSRPTIYSWLRGENAENRSGLTRVDLLWSIARGWEQLSRVPLRSYLKNRPSVRDDWAELIYAHSIDMEQCLSRLELLVSEPGIQHKRGVRELSRRYGMRDRNSTERNQSLAEELGI